MRADVHETIDIFTRGLLGVWVDCVSWRVLAVRVRKYVCRHV